mgnify:CR=1 FL=1
MKIFIPNKDTFLNFLQKRLETVDLNISDIKDILDESLNTTFKQLSFVKSKYNKDNHHNIIITVANNCQMCLVYYQLYRNAYLKSIDINVLDNKKIQYKIIADKVYYLNIIDTCLNVLYTVKLPLKTHFEHPQGTIIGNATFSDNSSLQIYQQCTIGGSKSDSIIMYPNINGNLIMYSKSSLLGNTQIKGTVVLSFGTQVYNAGLIENKIVFGISPNLIFKDIKKNYILFKE